MVFSLTFPRISGAVQNFQMTAINLVIEFQTRILIDHEKWGYKICLQIRDNIIQVCMNVVPMS